MIFLWVAEMVEGNSLVRVFYCLTIWSLGLAKNLSSGIGKNGIRPICSPSPNFAPRNAFAPCPVFAAQWLELSHDSRPCLRLLGFPLGPRSRRDCCRPFAPPDESWRWTGSSALDDWIFLEAGHTKLEDSAGSGLPIQPACSHILLLEQCRCSCGSWQAHEGWFELQP
jgi:hypothetical protein